MRLMHWLRVLVVRGLAGGAGFLATVVAARQLGADAAGLVFLALAMVTVVAGLARLGHDIPVVRFVGAWSDQGDWVRVNGVMRLALLRVGAAATAGGLLLFLLREPLATTLFGHPRLADVLGVMAAMVPAVALYWLHAQGFIGTHRAEIATFLQNALLPVCFIALFGVLALQGMPDARVAAACYLLASLLVLAMAAWLWWRQPRASFAGDADAAQLWRSAMPLWAVAAMNMAVQWSSQIAAGALLTPTDVAHLAAAQRTAMLIGLSLAVTNMVVAPRFAALHHRGDLDGLRVLAQRATRLMILAVTPIAAAVALAAPWVMSLFGDGFGAAAPLLAILVFGQWLNTVAGSVGLLLTMSGHERDLRNVTLVSGGLAIGLAVVLTMHVGVIGAAWATALAVIAQNLGALWYVKRRLGFTTLG